MNKTSKKMIRCSCNICNNIAAEKKILFDNLVKKPEIIMHLDLDHIRNIIDD